MPDDSKTNLADSIENLRKIDQICQQFESSWKSGRPPSIEHYVGNVEASLTAGLLRQLLLLDLDYRRRTGEDPSAAEYETRFPRHKKLISEAFVDQPTLAVEDTTVGAVPTEAAPICPGYEILRALGEGGMGAVYLARQSSPERMVALKIVRPDRLTVVSPERRRELLDRFRAEAQAAAQLEHGNIVPVYEVGQFGEQTYFSMRYIEGPSLHECLENGPLEGHSAAELLQPVVRAVHHAHVHGVLHRDIKPHNVLIDEGDHPYVTDFGLAKSIEAPSGLTQTGDILGTPSYMSPEQAQGQHDLDASVDIYGLGATLYEMCTGRPPFRAANFAETLRQVIQDEPVSPRRLNPAVDRDLETICLKCLEKERSKRYSTAEELAEELARFQRGEPILARPITRPARAWRWCKRNRTVTILGASAAILLLFLAIGGPLAALYARGLTERAEGEAAKASFQRDRAVAAETTAKQKAKELEVQRDRAIAAEDTATREAIEAGRQRDRAVAAEGEAKRAAAAKQLALYVSDMNRMERLWEQSDSRTMRTLLSRHHPGPGEPDLRCFVWHYWQRRVNRHQSQLNHGESIHRMAISQDRKWLATAGHVAEDRVAVRIWDLASGKLERTLTESKLDVAALAFVDEQATLSVVLGDHTHQEWDWRTGERQFSQPVFFGSGRAWADQRREAYAIAPSGQFFLVSNGSTVIQRAKGRTPFSDFKATVPGIVRSRLPNQILDTYQADPSGRRRSEVTVESWLLGDAMAPPIDEDGGTVFSLTLSPDEGLLAAGSRGGELYVWDLETGQQLARIAAHDDIIWDVAFSPDERLLATASKDGSVKVWDLQEKRLTVELAGHEGSVRAVAFSNNKLLATAGDDRTVRVWSPANGRSVALFRGHDEAVIDVEFGTEDDLLWSASRDGTVKLWAVQDDDHPIIVADKTPLYCLDITSDGQILAAGGSNKQVALWDLNSGRLKSSLVGNRERIFHLRFVAGGEQVVAAALDGTLIKWSTASGEQIWERPMVFGLHVFGMPHVAISPDGRQAAGLGLDRAIRIIELEPDGEPDGETIIPVAGQLTRILFTPDGQQVLTVSVPSDETGSRPAKKNLTLWDSTTGKVATEVASGVTATHPAFSDDGRYLAWHESQNLDEESSSAGRIVVWDTTTRKVAHRLLVPEETPHVWAIALSANGAKLAALAIGDVQKQPVARVLMVWDSASGELLQRVAESGRSVAFTSDGHQLLVPGHDGQVRVWNVSSGQSKRPNLSLARPSGPAVNAVFLPDGRSLVVVGYAPSRDGRSNMFRTTIQLDERVQKQTITPSLLKNWKPSLIMLADQKVAYAGNLWQRLGLDPSLVAKLQLSKLPFPREVYAIESNEAFVLSSTGALLRSVVTGRGPHAIAEGALPTGGICTAMATSPDGRRVAIASGDAIHIWDGKELKYLHSLEGHQGYIHTLAFTNNGKRLASGGTDRTVRVWDVYAGTAESVLVGHSGRVLSVAFSADGRTVASSCRDGMIHLWDAETGQSKTVLSGHAGPVHWVGFAPGGSAIVSIGDDGAVRVWKTMAWDESSPTEH